MIYVRTSCRSSRGLTWHDGAIPEDELCVKLGGDKGRGSFKFNLQLVNTHKPNSLKGTSLISLVRAGDSTTNLHIALDMYREQVKELQGMVVKYGKQNSAKNISLYVLRGRTIKVFMSGDYEFLCRIYGLSGASGM